MQTTSIIELVHRRIAEVPSQIPRNMLIAVLETLAERDLDGAQTEFAAQLPEEYREVLRHRGSKAQERFDAAEFVRRVAQRAGISARQSETWTRATFSALVESVPTTARDEFISALPRDFYPYAMWDV